MELLSEPLHKNPVNRIRILLLFLIITSPFFTNAQQYKPGFKSYWDKGYHLDSDDGSFKIKFGGRIQEHWSFFIQDDELDILFGKANNGSEFRRIRFYNSGTIYNSVKYKIEFDFASGKAAITDGYITIVNLPIVGNIRIGHFKEPFSLDMMTSSNNMTFMERSPATSFKKQRNNGLLFFNTAFNKRGTWAIGLYQNTDKFGKSTNEEKYNITGRVTVLPIYDEEKTQLLHIGIAYSYRKPAGNEYSVKSAPEAHLAPNYVSTGTINNVSSNYMAGGELAIMLNSFSLQSEYIASGISTDNTDFNFSGYYIETSYFLTGEHKNYSPKSGMFKKVKPKNNFSTNGEERGSGAWELAFRYSSIDLSNKSISGGTLNGFTAALNWYLNPATRFALNYTRAELKDIGTGNIFQFKFQVAF